MISLKVTVVRVCVCVLMCGSVLKSFVRCGTRGGSVSDTGYNVFLCCLLIAVVVHALAQSDSVA